ncbi:hypothetical protein [Streptomyces clavuligerus]|uniref:Type II toxin-antitoxin system RelE/ParE family toxin n=1 Tax=Streptomyces clavuligerus TaxID=1901 RepID=Q6TMR0_STRCL|nr:hypothetical protein [Streptomyces clavuligerus]AAQ93563.1 hypothetical protein pSCL2.6.A8.9 [Streptomyces clavuligerus]AXU16858.1 hypothetical protein D1794_29280 [Streptomyces clavuligerus]EDY48722.1 conserved hypothetical protein [Streptomyces clavuligerus]MBY6300991.1 hypothetical protein [Streptomyces clavuligerus]QPJ96998.1 hypothetical protein GE265_28195 [Streptomyces clavuligerus]
MTAYKVVLAPQAQRALAGLVPERRRAVHEAMRGPLSTTPLAVGTPEGTGPDALRKLAVASAGVTIGYRVINAQVEVRVVSLLGWP